MRSRTTLLLVIGFGIALVIGGYAGAQLFSTGDAGTVGVAEQALGAEEGPQLIASIDPAGAATEGIQVHGDWTIEVRDPDGTLADRRVFTNDLMNQGKDVLIGLLAGDVELTGWGIGVFSIGSSNVCTNDASAGSACLIVEPNAPHSGNNISKNLVVTTPPGEREFVLSGSFTGQVDGQFNNVRTMHDGTFSSGAPFGILRQFTETGIDSISVQAGQLVIITVIISFS